MQRSGSAALPRVLWSDSLIVLVSGWHDTDNVADGQWYDPLLDEWRAGTLDPARPEHGASFPTIRGPPHGA